MPYVGTYQRSPPVLVVERVYQRSPPVVLAAHQMSPAVVMIGFGDHQGEVLEVHVAFVRIELAAEVVSRKYGIGPYPPTSCGVSRISSADGSNAVSVAPCFSMPPSVRRIRNAA